MPSSVLATPASSSITYTAEIYAYEYNCAGNTAEFEDCDQRQGVASAWTRNHSQMGGTGLKLSKDCRWIALCRHAGQGGARGVWSTLGARLAPGCKADVSSGPPGDPHDGFAGMRSRLQNRVRGYQLALVRGVPSRPHYPLTGTVFIERRKGPSNGQLSISCV